VDLRDACWLERRALVRAAARFAFMIRLAIFPTLAAADGAVIGQRPTAAQPATAPQLGIQHIKDVDAHLELAELHLAEYRPDDPLDVALVAGPGVELELGGFQPSVDQVADRGLDLVAGGPERSPRSGLPSWPRPRPARLRSRRRTGNAL
jgi:hypothetical protein